MKRFRISLSLILALVLLVSLSGLALAKTHEDTGKPLSFMMNEHSSITYNEDSAVIRELAKRTGQKIELTIIPSSDYDTKLNAMLAANDLPDLFKTSYANIQKFAMDDMFVNLSECMDQLPNYAAVLETTKDSMRFFTIEGSYYHFARIAKTNPAYLAAPMIRQDVLDAVGMALPTNFDELYETLKAIKAFDPACIPWSTRGNNFAANMGYSFGIGNSIYYEPTADAFWYAPIHEGYKELLQYLNKLYTDKLIDPDYLVATSAQWQENMSSGKSYFFYDNTTFSFNFNKALAAAGSEARFVPMLTLKNSKGDARSLYYAGIGVNSPTNDGFAVNSESANIGGALELMDYMYSEEGVILTNWGIEGEHFTVENGEKIVSPALIEQFSTMGDPWRAYQAFLGTGTLSIDPYFDNYSSYAFYTPEQRALHDFWGSDPASSNFTYLPTLNAEETERQTQINSVITTFFDTATNEFIMGIRSFDTYDGFVQDLLNAGAKDLEALYAGAYERYR